jgi:hypothetical protein
MNARLPATLARALAPMDPPLSVVHQIVSEDQAARIDALMWAFKQRDGYAKHGDARALRLQQAREASTRVMP